MSPLTEKERDAAAERRSRMVLAIVTAILTALPPTVMAFAAWNSSRETHGLVNSRMDEFKALLKEQSEAREAAREMAREAVRNAESRPGK